MIQRLWNLVKLQDSKGVMPLAQRKLIFWKLPEPQSNRDFMKNKITGQCLVKEIIRWLLWPE